MAEIFVCPKGSVSDRSIRALRESGVIVVQADDPSACRFIRAEAEISSADMLWAALSALQDRGEKNKYGSSDGHTQREALSGIFCEMVNAARVKRLESATKADAVDLVGERVTE